MIDLLGEWQEALTRRFPGLRMAREDAASARIDAPSTAGWMDVTVFVHHMASAGLSATRHEPGMTLSPADRLHGWVNVRDENGAIAHHEATCSAERFVQIVAAWIQPPAAVPAMLVLAPREAPRKADASPETVTASIARDVDTSLLAGLPEADAEIARCRADLARLDMPRTAQHWPRDERGRLAARTSVVLGAYGPATRKRQPCLLLTSATQREMPAWRLHLSSEFLCNHRHAWTAAPWLWAADAAPEPACDHEAQARALLAQGRIGEACTLFGVRLTERVRRLAMGQPFLRYEAVPPAWPQELASALFDLAPWRLAAGLERIQRHLAAANRQAPKPGSWERKLFWFSGQRQQMRWGLGLRIGSGGHPELDLIATASNEHVPQPDWKQA